MNYCKKCILPDSRPGITIGKDGICSGCMGHYDKKVTIDWTAREAAFRELVENAKNRSGSYDCIVTVSGGKDSWYQVVKAREYGLNVLAVTWKTPARTPIGQENLDRMIQCLNVDHIDYTVSPDVERRFMKAAYEEMGVTGLPMHMALFAIPIRLAVQMRIPLVIWGENVQLEYGGSEKERLATRLDEEWLSKHGCLQSTRAEDWIGKEGLTADDLAAYMLPRKPDFEVDSIFLGAFFEWSSTENKEIAIKHGFKYRESDRKVGVWDFADIDCDFISLHHITKWQKFGITRAFDNLSVQIRYGEKTREEAIEILRGIGLQIPREDIEKFCAFQGLPVSWFWETAEKFRNPDIWKKIDGQWRIPGFLIDDWDWSQ